MSRQFYKNSLSCSLIQIRRALAPRHASYFKGWPRFQSGNDANSMQGSDLPDAAVAYLR